MARLGPIVGMPGRWFKRAKRLKPDGRRPLKRPRFRDARCQSRPYKDRPIPTQARCTGLAFSVSELIVPITRFALYITELIGLAPKSETTSLDSKSSERRMSDEFVSTEIHAGDRAGCGDAGRKAMRLDAPTHRLDEFPVGYSLAGCAPAEPASASPTGSHYAAKGRRRQSKTGERSTVSKLFVSPQGASPPQNRRCAIWQEGRGVGKAGKNRSVHIPNRESPSPGVPYPPAARRHPTHAHARLHPHTHPRL